MKIGSLFSGYGGLELGIAEVLDAEPVWHVEFDAAPSKILEHHWPAVPNLGDVTAVDWAAVEPVDVLCGGFPCQDVSTAGLRRGLHPDTRSGLWSHFALAIDALRPPLVIIENVRGLLSAEAHSDVEPDPWDLGGSARDGRPPLRALGAVLGDLADLGYDARWQGVRAADAGAPHGRFRVFIIAWPAPHADGFTDGQPACGAGRSGGVGGVEGRPSLEGNRDGAGTAPDRAAERGPAADRGWRAPTTTGGWVAPADTAGSGWNRRPARLRGAHAPAPGSGDPAPDTRSDEPERRGGPRPVDGPPEEAPRPRHPQHDAPRPGRREARDWGPYRAAIARWEHALGRLAPAPTERGPQGAYRLNPAFVEWMMGLPAGHVTDPAIGLTRSEQLKALGNGVVPQQAALALRTLLTQP